MESIAHSACVGMFHSNRLNGETRSLYSGYLAAIGKRPKKPKPAANVEALSNNRADVKAVTKIAAAMVQRTDMVRAGLRHS